MKPKHNAEDVWNKGEPVLYSLEGFNNFIINPELNYGDLKKGILYDRYLIYGREDRNKYSYLYVHNLETKFNYTRKVLTEKLRRS